MARKKKPDAVPAKAKRLRRSPRKKKVVTQGPYDSSWTKDHPIRKFSKKLSDYPWKASSRMEYEGGNPPRTCGEGYCFIGKYTDRYGKRRWLFSFPNRDARNRFVERCSDINGCSARREYTDPATY